MDRMLEMALRILLKTKKKMKKRLILDGIN